MDTIIVDWERKEHKLHERSNGTQVWTSTWLRKEYPADPYTQAEEANLHHTGIFNEDHDSDLINEDLYGDRHIRRAHLIEAWDEELTENQHTQDDEADYAPAIIEFVKFIRNTPPGAHITITQKRK